MPSLGTFMSTPTDDPQFADGIVTLVELLHYRASHQGDEVVYRFLEDGEAAGQALTFAQLAQRSLSVAAFLQERVRPGERVLLCYPPGLDFVAGFFGCLCAGAVAVPVYPPRPNRPNPVLDAVVAQAQPTVVLTNTALAAAKQQRGLQNAAWDRLDWLATDSVAPHYASSWRSPRLTSDSLAALQFTSGSTSLPRGVMLKHRHLLHNSRLIAAAFGHDRRSRVALWLPPYHDMGLIGGIVQPLYVGFQMVLMAPAAFLQKPATWLRAISHHRATTSGGPNFGYRLCVERIGPQERQGLDLSSWTVAFNGAEPIDPQTLERFAEAFEPCGFRRESFYPCYGLAEGTLFVSGARRGSGATARSFSRSVLERGAAQPCPPATADARILVSCGTTSGEQKLAIVDPESRQPVAPGAVGEIWVCGPSVAAGYWSLPEESARTFAAGLAGGGEERYLRTGDLGFVEDGELYVTGRLKDLIIVNGRNHHPQDIERTLERSHTALRPGCGAAFAIDADGGEALAVVHEIERTELRRLDAHAVVRAMLEAVAREHELGVHTVALVRPGTIPKTSSGKIRRAACRSLLRSGRLELISMWTQTAAGVVAVEDTGVPPGLPARPEAQPSSDAIVSWLIARLSSRPGWEAVRIDPDEPFTRYGIGSVEAVGIAADLGDWLGRSLPPTLAWDYPSVRALAAYLAGESRTPAQPSSERPAEEFVAIVGIGCRFPGAGDPDSFWDLLHSGRDAVRELSAERWQERCAQRCDDEPGVRTGGFLERVDEFDAEFFGIAPREVLPMDPQQRLLLEVAWEALEDAGIPAEELRGTRSGVFVGISTLDYSHLVLENASAAPQAYGATGAAASIAANRLSYVLDLRGPSLALDTACSSSLVAVHTACRSLLDQECDLALVGGVNLILSPALTRSLAQANMMSPSARCRAFDAAADGYVRGEGCGVVVLKRLADARADGSRILAVVRGSAVNQDGRSNGLTAPNGPAQQAVVRAALQRARVAAAEIGYIEAHGTGTPLGDPIEVDALKAVLLEGRAAAQACAIGSVKTNIGHLEAAAGVAGLIKTVLALHHEQIPASLHVQQLNPNIRLQGTPLTIAVQARPWLRSETPRYAGVSSFGFGGTNCHVVLEEGPAADAPEPSAADRPRHVLALSARNEAALREVARRYVQRLASGGAGLPAADVAFSANTGRSQLSHRVAVAGDSSRDLQLRLAAYAGGESSRGLVAGGEASESAPRIAFLFTGQGSQYVGMGAQLYATQPVFRKALERCAALLDGRLGRPLLEVLYPQGADPGLLDQTAYTQPALFALEYALCELWRSWGVQPGAVLGHSVGEYVAACVAGVFSLEEGLRLVAERGRLMQQLPPGGAMSAVWCEEGRVAAAIAGRPGMGIAALNGPENTVISGPADVLEAALTELGQQGVGSRALNVSHAFHSPLMLPIKAAFERMASGTPFVAPCIDLIANVTGRLARSGEVTTAEYWARQLCEPVRFADGVRELHALGYNVFVEIGPNPTLVSMGARCLDAGAAAWLPSLRRGQEDWSQLLDSLAALYVRGAHIDWTGFDAPYARRRIPLPSYAFQRQRYWIAPAPALAQRYAGTVTHPLLGQRLPELARVAGQWAWEVDFAGRGLEFLRDHRVQGTPVMPLAGYLEAGLTAGREALQQNECVIADLELHNPLYLPEERPRTGQYLLNVEAETVAALSVYSRVAGADARARDTWTLHATAQIRPAYQSLPRTQPHSVGGVTADAAGLRFGLMFFASSEDSDVGEKYRLVIEASRYADREGFGSVWVPERHFGKWGGLYPNPSVLHAALARETRRVRLRAGSVVLPLHDVLRVVEEWSVVDNLSGGRVDLSFASGWNAADFVLAPQRYEQRHEELFAGIETVKRLWRGEALERRAGDGQEVAVRTYPTPVQREVGVWVTAAGNPRTFERAGEIGANLLTHLLDQGVEELGRKIALYRQARARSGHDPASGQVSVMLHTFVGAEVEQVRERVRAPFCAYLKTLTPLLNTLARSRGRGLQIESLSGADLDEFVNFLYERFFATRALLGTPESCRGLIEQLEQAGVNEAACLLDFGPGHADILDNLVHLNRLRRESAQRAQGSQPAQPVLHVSGPQALEQPALELGVVRARCAQAVSGEQFYAQLQARGVDCRGSFASVRALWLGVDEALGAIELPAAAPAAPGAGAAATGVLDACLQVFVAAGLGGDDSGEQAAGLYLPKAVGEFRCTRALGGGRLWSHARVRSRSPEALSGDVHIVDDTGAPLAHVLGVRLQRAQRAPAGQALEPWLYELNWEPAALVQALADPGGAPARASAVQPAGRWLVLADELGIGAQLAAQLERAGQACVCVRAQQVDLHDARALSTLLHAHGGAQLRGVIHLWSVDSVALEQCSPAQLQAEQRAGALSAVRLMQALIAQGPSARLWLVTRGAQAVAGERALAVSPAPLWGLGRTCALEHAPIWGGLVDLDPQASVAQCAEQLERSLRAGDEEDQSAWRAGQRYVARLVHAPLGQAAELRIHPEASYLITGGLWGLGFEVARWLAARGARQLLLIGRSALPERAQWGSLEPGSRAAQQVHMLQALEAQGVQVRYGALDIAQEGQLRAWWEQQQESGLAPLRGVVHAASVWQDAGGQTLVRPLLSVDEGALWEVFAPKVQGSLVLERVLGGQALDFFVCFSSGASLVGSLGQGNYAGASAFLDALAQHRRAGGRAGLSVNWGAISQAGFGASEQGRKLHRYWEGHGIGRITPEQMLQALERFVPQGRAQVGVMRNDWRALARAHPQLARLPVLRKLIAQPSAQADEPSELLSKLQAAPAKQRRALLVAHVRGEVARVMGLPVPDSVDVRRGLFDMGMDSLMALDLRSRLQAALGREIPATVAFEFPTVDAIGGFLAGQLALEAGAEAAEETSTRPAGEVHTDLLERVRQLSDEEVERRLGQKASGGGSLS